MPETAGPIGAALGLAVASGLSLYGAAFISGLVIRLGWIHLAPGWSGLAVLADPVVLGVSGVLFAVEFLADKIPVVDSLWDTVHTVVRPVGGALLASRVLGELSPVAEVLALLLLGGATLATHAAKATTRLAVNTSPEPVSNILVSLTENGLLAAAVWMALAHPLVALGVGVGAVTVSVMLTLWLARRAIGALRRVGRGQATGPSRGASAH